MIHEGKRRERPREQRGPPFPLPEVKAYRALFERTPPAATDTAPPTPRRPGKGKGLGKGKGGGGKGGGEDGGKGGGKSLFTWTPDGRMICFKFNNTGEECEGQCGMVHCCLVCLLTDHGHDACPQRAKGNAKGKGKKGKAQR